LRGVKLVISDDQSGRRRGLARQLATLPRVHFMRNVLAHAGRQGRRVVSASIGTAFVQDDAEAEQCSRRIIGRKSIPSTRSNG
jgi:putative transposase